MSKLLFEAVKTKNLAGIKEILSSGASPNVVDVDGTPLLHMCIKFGDQPLLEYILSQYNTNLNITDPSGNTGLHAAASTNNLEFIKTLLNSGINPKKKNQSGQVALDLTSDVACKTTLAGISCLT
jgi:ankyrin repeat protein